LTCHSSPIEEGAFHASIHTIAGKIVGEAALGKIVRHAPAIRVDPFHNSGPA
jgi:hypothetical protein